MFLDITDRVLMEQEKAQLEPQNIYLQEEIRSQHNFVEIVGNSRSLLAVLQQVDQVAPTEATVLIQGETGTGKELIARAIHDRSRRDGHPLVKVNCGAISANILSYYWPSTSAISDGVNRKSIAPMMSSTCFELRVPTVRWTSISCLGA